MAGTAVNRNINNLHPTARKKVGMILAEAKKQGLNVALYEGFRTVERQNWLYNQGRSRLKGNQGGHTKGTDFDIVFKDKKGNWTWNAPESDWKKLGKIGTDLGCEWGGNWSKFVDRPHFQLKKEDRTPWNPPSPPLSNLQLLKQELRRHDDQMRDLADRLVSFG